MSIAGQDLIVNRKDLSDTQVVPVTFPDTPQDGECLLRVDCFSLTANNITYAVAPESIGYWNFFPTPKANHGRVPVWGFAEVVASAHPQVPVGKRVYGYLPMSTHLMIRPGKVTDFGMLDTAEHRQPMATIYNQYSFADADPAYAPQHEGIISLLRPLFTTSFLLDDYHRSNDCFGATQLVLSSASSKTALGMAFLMAQEKPNGLTIVGLTSPRNVDFTQNLGIYDKVVTYKDVASLPQEKTAFVDMAGNADTLRDVHRHFDTNLMNSCRVGLTHWQNTSNFVDGLAGGPKPAFFFAPTYAQDRIKEWTPAGFQKKAGKASAAFFGAAAKWMQIENGSGAQTVQNTYLQMLKGNIDPSKGHVLSLHG